MSNPLTPNHYRVEGSDYYDIMRKFFPGIDAARAHALKKLMFAGKRGAKDEIKDLLEAVSSVLDEVYAKDDKAYHQFFADAMDQPGLSIHRLGPRLNNQPSTNENQWTFAQFENESEPIETDQIESEFIDIAEYEYPGILARVWVYPGGHKTPAHLINYDDRMPYPYITSMGNFTEVEGRIEHVKDWN